MKEAGEGTLSPVLPPRANPELLGRATEERTLRRAFEMGRLPHALLLGGPRGIGKATLAFRLARFALAQGSTTGEATTLFGSSEDALAIASDSGTFRRVASGGHADLLTVERAYDSRRRRLRSEIVVDDTRQIAGFLRLTAAEGGWRVVVIDGADEMNRNAANALLKILEEPPQRTLLLLVAHSPGQLLPTIRSRCQHLMLPPLPNSVVRELLTGYRPDLAQPQVEALTELSGGSIGRALDLAAAGGIELYEAVLALLSRERGIDAQALHAFADRLARSEAEDAYRAVEDLLAQLSAALAVMASRAAPEEHMPAATAMRRLGERAPALRWAELHGELARGFARADALNLDRKQTILSAFFAIENARVR